MIPAIALLVTVQVGVHRPCLLIGMRQAGRDETALNEIDLSHLGATLDLLRAWKVRLEKYSSDGKEYS